jgi:glutamyl-tRNA reductase
MSELLAIGVSHKTAPIELRERLVLTDERAGRLLSDLRGTGEIHEAAMISTCNRTELYLVVGDRGKAEGMVLGMLSRESGIPPTELAAAIFTHQNCDVARHLYRVTAGLESMVVGEAEVQGQIKRAYEGTLSRATTGPLTNHLFKAALATGKRVRTETAIGEGQLSLASVAVMLARELLGGLGGRRVVILGTGETSELTARALADSGGDTVFVATRRRDRAISLARRYGGDSVSFDELPEALAQADVVVSATSSPHLLIESRELAEVLATRELADRGAARESRPMLLIDLAVPRDIDAACAELGPVSLYDVDDLQAVIDRNRSGREGEATRAEGIIEEEIQSFATWLGSLEMLPTLTALRSHASEIAEQVIRDNDGKWDTASERDIERVEAISRAIVNRLLDHPTARIKELRDDRVHARMALVRDLFGLTVDEGEAVGGAAADAQDLSEIRRLPQRQR